MKAIRLSGAEAPYLISARVAKFVDRLASLSSIEWEAIQHAISLGTVEVTMLEASRNAAVALAVRDLISRDQFDQLYKPFVRLIPVDSLEPATKVD